MDTQTAVTTRGGGFLLAEGDPAAVFTPERLTDEHRMAAR